MMKKVTESGAGLEGIDRLFGCDLRAKGWVVQSVADAEKKKRRGGRKPSERSAAPDPAVIWALRGRRR